MVNLVGISSESTSIPNNSRSNKVVTPLIPRIPVRLPEAFAAWRLCSLPRRITGRKKFFFYSRKDAETQRNCGALGMTFRRGGLAWRLGGFARLPRPPRRILFFFSQSLPAVDWL